MSGPFCLTRRSLLAGAAAAGVVAASRRALGAESPKGGDGGTQPMTAAFVGHGSPMTALDATRGRELAAWAKAMPTPDAVLCVSAHFEKSPVTIGATTRVPLFYDFRGFPRALYQVRYPAPGAPDLARRVAARLASIAEVQQDPRRGHDHGTWVPLRWMYAKADVPVLSVSLPGHAPKQLFRLGRALRPLRDEGVLILGSGMMTHNWRARIEPGAKPPSWSTEFDAWARRALDTNDVDALLDWQKKAPAARTNHPTVEHFVPLLIALGARRDGDPATYPITGYSGTMSRRCVQFG